MGKKIFMSVEEVADELDISVPFAYKIIRTMNKELSDAGYFTISGKIDRRFFHEKFYGTSESLEKRGVQNGRI